MSTSRILLPILAADLPAANPAVRAQITSSGVGAAGTPKVTYSQLQFNQATDQHALWSIRTPADYLSGGTLAIKLGAAVNAGNVVMSGGLLPIIDGFLPPTTAPFATCDVSATVAVPGSIGNLTELSWALTAGSVAGSRWLNIFLGRRASIGADTAAGDAYVLAAEFSYNS